MKKSFTCTLLGTGPDGKFPYVEPPFDTVAVFGTKGRVPVKVTVNGVTMEMSLAPMGGRHVLGFRGELAKRAGIAVGDRVRMTVEKDTTPRVIEPPPDLARALAKDRVAKATWEALAYSHKREHANAILEAKKPETRARRVAATIAMLAGGGKPAKPAPSTKPLAARLHVREGAKVVIHGAPRGFDLGVRRRARARRISRSSSSAIALRSPRPWRR